MPPCEGLELISEKDCIFSGSSNSMKLYMVKRSGENISWGRKSRKNFGHQDTLSGKVQKSFKDINVFKQLNKNLKNKEEIMKLLPTEEELDELQKLEPRKCRRNN